MAKKKTKTEKILQRVGHELKTNEPRIVAHTRAKFGAERARRQKKAILLSKARKAGARIPYKKGEGTDYLVNIFLEPESFPPGTMIPGTEKTRVIEQEIPVHGSGMVDIPLSSSLEEEIPITEKYGAEAPDFSPGRKRRPA